MPGKAQAVAERRAEVRRRYFGSHESESEIALAVGYSQATISRDIAFIEGEGVAELARSEAEKRAKLLGKLDQYERYCHQAFAMSLEPREIQDKSKTEGPGGSTSRVRVRREPARPDVRSLEVGLRCLDMERQLLGIEAGPSSTLPPEAQVEISDLDQPEEIKRLVYLTEGGARDPLAQAGDRFPRGFSAPQ